MPFDRTATDWIAQARLDDSLPLPAAAVVPAAAAAADYEIPVYVAPSTCASATLSRLSLLAAAAITGAATNYQTVQFRQWRAGALVGTLAGASTYATTASLAAQTPQVLLSGAALTLQAGDVLTLQSAHTGTGAALPALTAVVEVSPTVEPS